MLTGAINTVKSLILLGFNWMNSLKNKKRSKKSKKRNALYHTISLVFKLCMREINGV